MHDFSEALKAVKTGRAICREGWNGKNLKVLLKKTEGNMTDFLYIKYPYSGTCCPWVPSQSDLFANDWVFIE